MATKIMSVETLKKYLGIKEKLSTFKKLEADMRLEVLSDLFGDNVLGNRAVAVGDFVVKGGFGQSLTLDKNSYIAAEGELSLEAQEAVTWTPSITKAQYDKLPEEVQLELEPYVTIKPSMPTLKAEFIQEDE